MSKKSTRRQFIGRASMTAALASVAGINHSFSKGIQVISNQEMPGKDYASDYLLSKDVTYFNHGSIGTIPKIVQKAHVEYLELCETNPWLYMWGDPWKEQREIVRTKTAAYIGADPEEVVFAHNTTEAMNMLASGLNLSKGDEVLFSSWNHSGASVCWEHYGRQKGYAVRRFEMDPNDDQFHASEGVLNAYLSEIRGNTKVLVVPHIDNILGVNHPIKELTSKAKAAGVEYVVVDGAQSIGMIPVNMHDLGIDFYATSPHKWIQSPKGLGIAYFKKELQDQIQPLVVSWGQNSWEGKVNVFEDFGTRNLAELMTLGNAIDFQLALGMDIAIKIRKELRDHLKRGVASHSKLNWRSPDSWDMNGSLYALEVLGIKSYDLSQRLFSEHGIVFRPFSEDGWNTIRLSLNVNNSKAEIDRFLNLI